MRRGSHPPSAPIWRAKADRSDTKPTSATSLRPEVSRRSAEAKGRTAAVGLDVDTLFGSLLRRMKPEPSQGDQYAAVLPSEAREAVMRVPERVRQALGVRVFLVSPDNEVTEL